MYINNISILYYFFAGLSGMIVGQFTDWLIKRTTNKQKIFCKELFCEYIPYLRVNSKLVYPMAILYMILLATCGVSLKLLEYMLISPLLVATLVIDIKQTIIPNRITLMLFEIGIIFTAIFGFDNIDNLLQSVGGMLIGGAIFIIITLVGKVFVGKEAMGLGDVKLMIALGLIFGMKQILMISVASFLIGAIISIILLIAHRKKNSDYIAFAPFIVIATFLVMLVPNNIMLLILIKIFTLGIYQE